VIGWYSGGASITANIPPTLVRFGAKNWLGLPRMVYLLAVVAAVAYYLLEHTPYGRHLRAIGVNPAAARLVGLRVDGLAMRAFIGSGAAAGLAGVMLVSQAGAANPGIGVQFTLTALSAGFLGATAIRPGSFNVAGTLLAIYFLGASITGLTFAGAKDYIGDLFTGLALVVAVAVSSVLARRRARG
jgi:ribose transport system permease protein